MHIKLAKCCLRYFGCSNPECLTKNVELHVPNLIQFFIYKSLLATERVFFSAEETEDDEVAAAGYEIFYTRAVDDSHIPKLNDTNFNSTVKEYDVSVVFFFLPCKSLQL